MHDLTAAVASWDSFAAGTLPAITDFVRELDAVPPPLACGWAVLPEFGPMTELRLRPDAGDFARRSGIGAGDRLFVHIGSLVYRDALVIASRANEAGEVRHFAARLLDLETEQRGPLLAVAGRSPSLVLTARGSFRIECVIFNRPDVLC